MSQVGAAGLSRSSATDHAPSASQPAKITVDYPLDGSVFPPEITPPTFLWRDASETAKRWVIEVSFADHSSGIRVETPGEHMQMGEIDSQAGADVYKRQRPTIESKPRRCASCAILRAPVSSGHFSTT